MRFESKIEWWIPALLFGGLSLGTLEWALDAAAPWYDSLGLGVSWVLSVWIVLQTLYEFRGDALLIRCGPFSRQVRVHDIESAEPSRNPLASMALSLDRIAIKVRTGRDVLISPRDKAHFLTELAKKQSAKKRAPKGPNCHERTG